MAETPTMEVRARLTAETAQFTSGMEKATQSMQQFAQQSSAVRGAITGIGLASAAATTAIIAFGTKAFMAAARVDELDVAMNAVGKSTGLGYQAIQDTAVAIKDMGIEMAVAQQSAIKFAQNNLDLAYASELARAAQDLAVVSGMNSTDTYNMLTHAVITGRSEVLKSVGIQKSAGQMYEEYAKSIGKSASALTYQEKQQATATGALKEAEKVAGAYLAAMESPGKVLRSFARLNNEIQVSIGQVLLKGFGPMIKAGYDLEKQISKAFETNSKFREVLDALKMVLVKLTKPITDFIVKIADMLKKFNEAKKPVEDTTEGIKKISPAVMGLANSFEFLLPAIAATMTMLATFAGAKVFANVPIFGSVLKGLAGPLGIVAIGLVTLYMTSSQVQKAVGNLVASLKPMLTIVGQIGKILGVVAGYAVAILAKAIQGLANTINSVNGFFQRHAAIARIVGGALIALTVAVIAYFTYIKLAAAATWLMVTAQNAWNAAQAMNQTGLIVAGIVALIAAFIAAWKMSETFRTTMTTVFNAIAKVVGWAVAIVMKTLGYLLLGYAKLMDTNNILAKVVSTVYEFMLDAAITYVMTVLKFYKFWIDSFISLVKEHKNLADGISAIFEFIARVIGAGITFVLVQFANIIKGIATLIYFFGKVKDFIGEVWGKIVGAIGKAVEIIGNIFGKLGDFVSGVTKYMREKFASFVTWILEKARKVPDALMPNWIISGLEKLESSLLGTKDAVESYSTAAESASVAAKVVAGQESINDAITKTSKVAIESAKGWGNYSDGIAGKVSAVANKILDFADKVVEYTSNIEGSKILDGLIAGAEKASSVLGDTISILENFKAKDVYKTLMDTASAGAEKAGNWLLATAATIESFTNSNFVEKVGQSIGNLLESLKTGLGFGDILQEEAKKYSEATGVTDNAAADALQADADRMKSIRDAMQSGIDSIKGVLDDLRNAAHDFANSLKDTIVGFAGLKGVELPDGFIPKAKSLIENMNSRLNKSMQFASQIQQLQSLQLNASSLKDIIEAGPIKGAQLAASIIGGGASAVAEINSLQKAIEYSGAAIGQMGSDAAFSGLIANAQAKYDALSSAQMTTSSSGSTVNIAQGAFQVSIDTGGMTSEEQLKAITDKIQETFAILAKELAAK